MKLTSAQIKQATKQMEARPVPDDSQLAPKLNEVFGDHTFFLASTGLHIVDSTGATDDGETTGRVVRLASWADEHCTSLAPHAPEFTGVVVNLGKAA
jgi:hypothetical protein